ncbi:MAG: tRNA threonylcarbamoyladenosine dehydratase [Peptococcaceae bacterium]|nr:tRNA threonylcarbamoyladenosine dehydratase [Peptococcaceae bacterium]
MAEKYGIARWQDRSRRLIGGGALEKLRKAHVLVCGLGGVGSFCAEALVRSGIGEISLAEFDQVAASNLNRQLPALHSTLGRDKLSVCGARFQDINPELKLHCLAVRLTPENLPGLLAPGNFDYIADAIDDLPAKTRLLSWAYGRGIPVITSMGAGFRLDPTKLTVSDIGKTHTCPLARRLRRALKEEGISRGIQAVWSTELPAEPAEAGEGPASMIFVPASAGLLMASRIVKELARE